MVSHSGVSTKADGLTHLGEELYKVGPGSSDANERASESTDSRENRQTHVVKKFEGRFILLPFDTSVAVDLLFDLVVGASTCARAPP